MKVYIYCTKAKPNIGLNGKIVACFDLNKITMFRNLVVGLFMNGKTQKSYFYPGKEIVDKTAMTFQEIIDYGKGKNLYCWHIENLQVFDVPMELSEFYQVIDVKTALKKGIITECEITPPLSDEDEEVKFVVHNLNKAPQSWCYARREIIQPMYCEYNFIGYDEFEEDCILISIKPQWVEKILNGEQTIIVKKTAPKELLEKH